MFKFEDIPKEKQDFYRSLIESNRSDSKKRKVAVVSFYHNRDIWTKIALPTLTPEKMGMKADVFTVNDASTDTTEVLLNTFESKYNTTNIKYTENKGKPWTFNHILNDHIDDSYDYVVSIDGDIILTDNWLTDMITCFEYLERNNIKLGQLACDYELLPICQRTVNPNTMTQPQHCKILKDGIILDTFNDVAGGCLIWKQETIKKMGGYKLITTEDGKHNLYGMDDGLINLECKRENLLSCYLVNIRAQHWGDYDRLIFPKYTDWKVQNLNPVVQSKIKPFEIGVEHNWEHKERVNSLKSLIKAFKKINVNPQLCKTVEDLYMKLKKETDQCLK